MRYLDCPTCHVRLHSGLLYAALEACPRCGAPLHTSRPTLGQRLHAAIFRPARAVAPAPDWEEITRSQYAERRYVSRPESGAHEADRDAAA
jgi:hypothetical protein